MIKLGSNSIGKMYLGSNKIGKAYLGSNLVYESGVSPVPVTTIPYVRNATTAYIDTGIKPDGTTRVIVWARNWNPASGYLFGNGTDSNNEFGLSAQDGAGTGSVFVRYNTWGSPYTRVVNGFKILSNYHKYELDGGEFKVDDVTMGTATAATFSSDYNIHLFGANNNGTHLNNKTPIDIAAARIYKNGVLVRDFTAVETPSVGLYDAVSGTVFTASGTGGLTYGTFETNAYVPIEYIEASGACRFDAGIKGSNSLNYVCKYRPNCTIAWPYLFGAQNSSSSKRYGVGFGNTSTFGKDVIFLYANTSQTYSHSASMNGNDYTLVKSGTSHSIYASLSTVATKTFTSSTFTTDYNILVGGCYSGGTKYSSFNGRLYYLGFASSRNFVPAKVNDVAGMYDTYNDVFYQSETSTPFTAGTEL